MSAKKLMRARVSASLGLPAAGKRCDGYASARKVATMPDSVRISPLKSMAGTRPRCGGHVGSCDGLVLDATYWVDLQVPVFPWLVQVNDYFFVF